jgi:anti-anti-sigma factor
MSVATHDPSPRPVAGLAATVFADGAVTVVALRGEADRATLHVVRDALADVIAEGDGDVVVDLAQTEFMDSAALRTVLRARERLEVTGRQLTLRSPSRSAGRLLAVFGLGHLASPQVSTERRELQ